ncbi:hypothetical protein [Streptomyces sp. Ag109_O5-1]|uniref:hypothetical protein n=1 Tax=Streptomyces sp. Ag109_O5-1 TaxID=1938851 RepID=UPI000F4F2C64|nr:hypothetical protein [Streptomyces sp. Ag109_O5-1]
MKRIITTAALVLTGVTLAAPAHADGSTSGHSRDLATKVAGALPKAAVAGLNAAATSMASGLQDAPPAK